MSAALDAWRRGGREISVFGDRIFVREAGPAGAPALLLLHGFPSSSHDFHLALPALSRRLRVVAHDHLGFGLSAKPADRGYSLVEQAEVALAVWRELGVTTGVLVAHDYGTSVATEILARRGRGGLALDLRGVALSNGSMLLELARRRPSQYVLASPLGPALARLASERFFVTQLRALLRRPVADEELHAMWAGVRREEGHLLLPRLSQYNAERVKFRERWVGALERAGLPTLLAWADEDPIARLAIAEELARRVPTARLEVLRGVGHYPMLEAPEAWAEPIERFAAEALAG